MIKYLIDYEDNLVKLYCGDCIEVMKGFDENSFDAIVTDPPYLLGFMSKKWDKSGKGQPSYQFHYQWAVEALRVVKPGGYLLVFGGTRTFHRLACAIEDAGFEFRDTIMWVYGSGFPKSLDVSKAIDKMKGAEREVIGHKSQTMQDIRGGGYESEKAMMKERLSSEITIPATSEAKEWEGWGTALKPAWEPILVFRKLVIGTVAFHRSHLGEVWNRSYKY